MRSCFAVVLWPVAAVCGTAPASTCGSAAAPSPASTAFVNVRRFTEPATDSLAFRRTADPGQSGGSQIFF